MACTAAGADFALPRSGDQNSRLHAVSSLVGGAWVRYTLSPGT
ncbi:secreted protein [Mycobacterium pseudoshottsii JCM 15466]|nr:secreted protein [Mycobacterium pseudoshottsii JCM 15466]